VSPPLLKSLGARVDAFTIAFRTRLDPRFVGALKQRAEVAREHGRAAFEWEIEEPNTDMGRSTTRRLGSSRDKDDPTRRNVQPARWVNGYGTHDRRRRAALWGELSYSNQRGVWRVVNEPFWRLQIQEYGPGGGDDKECRACRGLGWFPGATYGMRRETCLACKGEGQRTDPGWTVEMIWYAQELAAIGLAAALEESQAVARLTGDVLEARVRRIDLCADIQGWSIEADDVKRIAKRPRAVWAVDDVGPRKEPKVPRCARSGSCKDRCTCSDVQVYGKKNTLRDRAISGLAVGRGGALHARIYDKRCELENDRDGGRRRAEESRWKDSGWSGDAPVARVEFQIRGVALTELGIRDPHAVVRPRIKQVPYIDKRGKARVRAVVEGDEVLQVPSNDNGEPCEFCRTGQAWSYDGEKLTKPPGAQTCTCMRTMTIVDRLESLWRTCLDWVRLVEPKETASGKPIPVTRLRDDPRWALLRTVQFLANKDGPIRRYRPRGCASAAQALGCALAQGGRVGRLRKMPEGFEHYGNDDEAERKLHKHVAALFEHSASDVTRWLMDRFGGAAGAWVHLAVRTNASLVKWKTGIEETEAEERAGPLTAAS
jgi:hypothetical protein